MLSNTAQQHKQSGEGGPRGGLIKEEEEVMESSLTSILRGELPHGCGKALVKLVLAGDEGLADGLLPKTEHA